MGQKGEHTWDIAVDYQRCPHCGYIMESRQTFEYRLGDYAKEVACDRCGTTFTVKKDRKPSFGPLIGDPQPVEVEWGDPK